MTKSEQSPFDYISSRIGLACNQKALPVGNLHEFKNADKVEVEEISHKHSGLAVTLRRYILQEQVDGPLTTKVEVEYRDAGQRKDGKQNIKKVEKLIQAPTKITRSFILWEVEDKKPNELIPTTYIFNNPEDAASVHMHILSTWSARTKKSKIQDDQVTLSEALTIAYQFVAPASPSIRSTLPPVPDTPHRERIHHLISEIPTQSEGATTAKAREIAIRMYGHGETNIRKISRATGLTRDAIYLSLYAENLKKFKFSNIVSAIKEDIRSGRLQHGTPAPSCEKLSDVWKISLSSAKRVLAVLRVSGVLETIPGQGLVISRAGNKNIPLIPIHEQHPPEVGP